jgi:acetyl-CoA carboxylase carboxyl transferase subunit alpha
VWRDSSKKAEAAEALKLTAPDLLGFHIIDEVIKEPIGGAHTDHDAAARSLDAALSRALAEVSAMDNATRLDRRYDKFRSMGRLGFEFVEQP